MWVVTASYSVVGHPISDEPNDRKKDNSGHHFYSPAHQYNPFAAQNDSELLYCAKATIERQALNNPSNPIAQVELEKINQLIRKHHEQQK